MEPSVDAVTAVPVASLGKDRVEAIATDHPRVDNLPAQREVGALHEHVAECVRHLYHVDDPAVDQERDDSDPKILKADLRDIRGLGPYGSSDRRRTI